MSDNRVLVAATSLETGWYSPAEHAVGRDELVRLVHQLSTIDHGYLETRLVTDDFPVLLAGFRKGLAVVQCMTDPASMSLLAGDGSVPGSDLVDVLIMNDLATFSGEYVLQSASAGDVLLKFAAGADVRSLGEWHDL